MKTLIIQINKGGLGDHLFFSHLPRIAKQTGAYDKVFFSTQSECRHPDTLELVWKQNTWLDGLTNEPGEYHFPSVVNAGENLLDVIMLAYGLDDGKRFHEPEIYYTPKVNPKLRDAIIYDPNFISYTGNLRSGEKIKKWFEDQKINVDFQMCILGNRSLPITLGNSIAYDQIATNNLFELCDLIASCKRMYCLTTGTATLAAALGNSVTVFYGEGHDPLYRHSTLHEYIYLGTDYTFRDYLIFYITKFLQKVIPLGKK